MAKPTSIKEALKRWEEKNGESAAEAKDIGLQFQWLPIDKMDATLSTLVNCEKLSLSSNMIDKIVGLSPSLKNLKILSLSRNNIRSLAGVEVLGDTLEQLWISYNLIDKVKGIEALKKLKVFYIAYNLIRDWSEYSKLYVLENTLEDLVFAGNPVAENMKETEYRREAVQRLPFIKFLDGIPVDTDIEEGDENNKEQENDEDI